MMKILDEVLMNEIEYTCIQILYIDHKNVYKLYREETEEKIFVTETDGKLEKIEDKELLHKIKEMTTPKTDIIVDTEGI